ncbi:MAG: hypothetical protein D6794_11740 [Deltaproteobacteria bacterium]|nr:MAG: hypothetical protein D6794_11740 [Deltaproteobacteria bacterium]
MTRSGIAKALQKDPVATLLGLLTLLGLICYLGALGLQELHHARLADILANPVVQSDTDLIVAGLEGPVRN